MQTGDRTHVRIPRSSVCRENALRTLSFFTAVPFRGYVLRACQLIALSNNRSVDVKECDELTRAVRKLGKEQQ